MIMVQMYQSLEKIAVGRPSIDLFNNLRVGEVWAFQQHNLDYQWYV